MTVATVAVSGFGEQRQRPGQQLAGRNASAKELRRQRDARGGFLSKLITYPQTQTCRSR
jgi:hypothetical protein